MFGYCKFSASIELTVKPIEMAAFSNASVLAQRAIPYLLTFFIPTYFTFIMTKIRGPLVEFYHMGPFKHGFHIFMGTWFFVNILGNLFMGIFTNTTLRRHSKGSKYCDECKMNRPVESWHCFRCNFCIVRRDHHCYMMSRCIGLYNLRYFILFMLHVFISMLYSTYYLYLFVSLISSKQSTVLLSIFRFILPVLRFYVHDPLSFRDIYVLFLFLNIGLICWSGFFLNFHLKNLLMGVTARESRPLDLKMVQKHWKENVERVLGKRWYLTVFWPFIDSPLPENVQRKNK